MSISGLRNRLRKLTQRAGRPLAGHGPNGLPKGEGTVRIWMPDNGRDGAVVQSVAQQLAEGRRLIIYRADDANVPTSQPASARTAGAAPRITMRRPS